MYSFRKATIQPELNIDTIMATKTGQEMRFKSRFVKYAGTSDTFNQSVDKTGQAIDDLRTSAGMIVEQKKAIDILFLKAETAINEVNQLQTESGKKQVDNLPLPTDVIRSSYGKKLGYASLIMEFFTTGMLHFMEETINLEEALGSRDNTISRLAAQIPSLEIIGAFEEVSLSDLHNTPEVDAQTYVKPEKNMSSPLVGTKKGKKTTAA